MRPQTLAEVAERALADPDWQHHVLEFLDTFYGADGDGPRQSAMIAETPRTVGQSRAEAFIGGVGEHLARRWGLPIPRWVRDDARYLTEAMFVPDRPGLRGYLLAVSPVSFRSRLIFTGPDPLQRARFPYRRGVIRMPMDYPCGSHTAPPPGAGDRSQSMASIGILETGLPPADLAARFGRYDAMVRRMLGDAFAYRTYEVHAGELPVRPQDHAAYVITGSSAGVYDDLPWIAPLQDFIRASQGRARMVGLCFGHQVMAEALGGRVAKSDKGWGLGLHRYDLHQPAPWRDDVGTIAVAASHQDQVVVPPPGAAVLSSSAFTPYAALLYRGGDAVSFQFHPEFERGMAEALVVLRRPHLPDPAAADRMLESLAAASDAPRVAGWIRSFIAARS